MTPEEAKQLQELWMRNVINACRRDELMYVAVRRVMNALSLNNEDSRAFYLTLDRIQKLRTGKSVWCKSPTRVWLARYWRPISDGILEGMSDDALIAKWKRTTMGNRGPVTKPSRQRQRDAMRAANLARDSYAFGWRAKHDWKIVK